MTISIEGSPQRLQTEYSVIFTKSSKQFVCDLVREFEGRVEKLLLRREIRKTDILDGRWQPAFRNEAKGDWKIREIPTRIRNRKLDLGDVSPANTAAFVDALYANVQGIQVGRLDFQVESELR